MIASTKRFSNLSGLAALLLLSMAFYTSLTNHAYAWCYEGLAPDTTPDQGCPVTCTNGRAVERIGYCLDAGISLGGCKFIDDFDCGFFVDSAGVPSNSSCGSLAQTDDC